MQDPLFDSYGILEQYYPIAYGETGGWYKNSLVEKDGSLAGAEIRTLKV